MNTSYMIYKSASSKAHKRNEVTHPVSAKLFGHANSTYRNRDTISTMVSPPKKPHTPLSVPTAGSSRINPSSLRDIHAPSSLVSLKYTSRNLTEIKDLKLFKNLV